MRAIGLDQPYATLIARGVKTMETRAFPPTRWGLVRGERIAIHANKSRRMLPVCIREAHDAMEAADLKWPYLQAGTLKSWDPVTAAQEGYLPFGALVATATLADWLPTHHAAPCRIEAKVGDYGPGRFAWVLEDVEPLAPVIPYKGHQGAFHVECPDPRIPHRLL